MSKPSESKDITRRKAEHLELCLDQSTTVETGSALFDHVRLVHRSLPEVDSNQVDTSSEFLGTPITLPLFISSMTGGSAEGFKLNEDLARVAQQARIPVGTGSIRVLFRHPEVIEHFRLKRIATDVPVFANIGGVQLRGETAANTGETLVELLKSLEVDAVAVHLNPGQEIAQPEGDTSFTGVLDGIRDLCDRSPVPVIVKETGFGIAPDEISALVNAGATYVDVAGGGGTNWMSVEGHRLSESEQQLVDEFADWGVPTAALLLATRDGVLSRDHRILASGGIRTGMDVAKCVALGATAVGMALPFARAVAEKGIDGGLKLVEAIRSVFTRAMVLTGSRSIEELSWIPLVTSAHIDHLATQLAKLDRL